MTEPDDLTPRVKALLDAHNGAEPQSEETVAELVDDARTANQVAPAETVTENVQTLADNDATLAAGDVDDEDDDLPGSSYAVGAGLGALATPRLLGETEQDAARRDVEARAEQIKAREAEHAQIIDVDAEPTAVVAEPEAAEPEPETASADETLVMPEPEPGPTLAHAAPLYRDEVAEPTAVMAAEPVPEVEATSVLPVEDRDREAEREARAKRLGIVAAPTATTETVVPVAKPKRTTDKWHGSLGLFLLRLVTAAFLLTDAYAHLTHWTATKDFFAHSILPQPEYFAIGVVAAEAVAGLLLVFGLMTRFAGLLVLAVEILLLGWFVYGKSGAIYTPGQPGFKGDINILMASIGLLFLLLGAGGLSLDRAYRAKRAKAKEEKLLGNTV